MNRIAQFSKSPGQGALKTRLAAVLNLAQRRALHCAMTRHVCERAVESDIGETQLWVSGSPEHPIFQAIGRDLGVSCVAQRGADLGERLDRAAAQLCRDGGKVVFIGSDCPFITPDYLRDAFACLRECEAVLGPATDGGYVLLGLRRHSPRLFENIHWGSDRVLAQTEARLRALGWRYRLLEALPDVDRPDDLPLLAAPSLPESLRHFSRVAPGLTSD